MLVEFNVELAEQWLYPGGIYQRAVSFFCQGEKPFFLKMCFNRFDDSRYRIIYRVRNIDNPVNLAAFLHDMIANSVHIINVYKIAAGILPNRKKNLPNYMLHEIIQHSVVIICFANRIAHPEDEV